MSPSSLFSGRGRRALMALTLVLAIGVPGVIADATQAAPAMPAGATALAGPPGTGRTAGGTMATGQTYATPPRPTAEQWATIGADRADRGATPKRAVHTGPVAKPTGNPMPEPGMHAALNPTDLVTIHSAKLTGEASSGVDEPSTDTNGKYIFQTGNWYAGYSSDAGAHFTYLNPFTIFGSGFCCDQITILDTSHNREFWLSQYSDRLVLANADATNLSSWCSWGWKPGQFGLPTTDSFDYNHLAVDANYVYFSTNVYTNTGANAGALVARMPIDPQTTCSGFNYNWIFRTTEFADAFVQGAGDTMYWATTNSDAAGGLGSGFRILAWPDNAGAFVSDRTVDAFTYMTNGNGNCASADGVVLNWCQRTDSRMSGGGYVAQNSLANNNSMGGAGAHNNDGVVSWAFNAQQDAGHPFPYIRRVYFRTSDLAYIGYSENYASWGAFLYPDLAPNARGHVAEVWSYGGGTGTNHYYPGFGVSVDDDISPSPAWAYAYLAGGSGNPCLNTADGLRRWGDYQTIRPYNPSRDVWVLTAFTLPSNAGNCNAYTPVSVYNMVVGRRRDLNSYLRYWTT